MASKTIHSTPITFMDYSDSRRVDIYIASNLPTVQIYDTNAGDYTPDWTKDPLVLTATAFLDAQDITDNVTSILWSKRVGSGAAAPVATNKIITINNNELSVENNIITYICEVTYQNIKSRSEITFTQVSSGLNGADGQSVTILGTYESLEALQSAHPTGNAGDSYIVQGNLWVWAVDDAAWENVGNIQGTPGKDGQDAKAVFLNATTQIFKVNKSGTISPSTIKISAQPVNTSITSYSYSIDGGITFLSTADGISRSGNQITITGSNMTANSITIKASDGQYQDTITIYKVSDGLDGNPGNPGQPAPIAFLTNESIGFTANSKGEIASTSAVTNVVAFVGTTSVKPTIGTLSGVPEGMTITQAVSGNEILLTLTIADNSTLGSSKSNGGRITIPVTISSTPAVTTNLQLGWNKVNTGRSVSSIAARYAVSDSNTVAPTSWSVTIPIRNAGQYLWMADYITYDDGTNATVGPRVVTGDAGTPGVSITSVKSYFSNNQSMTSAPATTSTWTTTPTRQTGYYTWRKDLITYSDSRTEYTTPVCITGDKGDAGVAGTTYYTWIKYADTPTSGMSDSPTGKTYMGIAYNKTTSVESTNYSDYTWALIKGSNGTNGADGRQLYTWVKYADDANGTNMNDDPTGKSYIGLAYNKTTSTESTTASDYQWSLFKGTDGVNGQTSYFHVKYSSVAKPTTASQMSETPDAYIGTYVDFTSSDSTDPNKYTWTQFKGSQGAKGDQGIAGTNGEDGKTSYLHIAYATSADGKSGFSVSDSVSKTYIGQYTDYTEADSTDPTKYKWTLIKGDKGDQGVQGPKGNDGQQLYTWIKYADTPTSGMSNSPDGKTYIGLAYNKTTATESSTYSDYAWSLIKGSSGTPGKDGTTYYTWVKYADDASGSNMSDDPLNKSYIGLAYNKTSATESTTASDYQWSLFRGVDGLPGEDAVTFQVYSTDGYILSSSTPKITLQTFAYVGDTQITGDVSYQWSQVKDGVTTAISGANGSSYDVYHSDVSFTNTYICTMTFKGIDYSGVVTIDDKNDVNTVFSSKPVSYSAGDIWVVGADYIPSGVEIGTVLKAEHTNSTYSDSDWVTATKYDEHIKALEDDITQYNQYFSFDSQDGLRISARDSNGNASQFSTTLSNDRLSFNQGDESVAYIESNKLKIKEAEIISPLTVTGKYSGSTMQQAPIINIGNFSIVVESNGSLSIVANR